MLIKIETLANKQAKLTRFFDFVDFYVLALVGFLMPVAAWAAIGLPYSFTCWPGIIYLCWLLRFKANKPKVYWSHWLRFKLRSKHCTAYPTIEKTDFQLLQFLKSKKPEE
jgi:hypothetical protein